MMEQALDEAIRRRISGIGRGYDRHEVNTAIRDGTKDRGVEVPKMTRKCPTLLFSIDVLYKIEVGGLEIGTGHDFVAG